MTREWVSRRKATEDDLQILQLVSCLNTIRNGHIEADRPN